MNLPYDKVPLPIMAIPRLSKIDNINGTEIILDYKAKYLADIEKQLNNIEKHVLLFVNHLEKIKVNDKEFSCIKTEGRRKNEIQASIFLPKNLKKNGQYIVIFLKNYQQN